MVTRCLNCCSGGRGFLFRAMIRNRWRRRHVRSAVPAVATELNHLAIAPALPIETLRIGGANSRCWCKPHRGTVMTPGEIEHRFGKPSGVRAVMRLGEREVDGSSGPQFLPPHSPL